MSSDQISSLFNAAYNDTPKERAKFAEESAQEIRRVYKNILLDLTGKYHKTKVSFFKFDPETGINDSYDELVNRDTVTVISEETSFSVEEYRGPQGEGSYKQPCYTIAVKYRETDVSSAFSKMRAYIEEVENSDPPIDNTSGLVEVVRAWGFFQKEVPKAYTREYLEIAEQLSILLVEAEARAEKAEDVDTILKRTESPIYDRLDNITQEEETAQEEASEEDTPPEITEEEERRQEEQANKRRALMAKVKANIASAKEEEEREKAQRVEEEKEEEKKKTASEDKPKKTSKKTNKEFVSPDDEPTKLAQAMLKPEKDAEPGSLGALFDDDDEGDD